MLLGSTKVGQGQRYHSDDDRLDPYFDNVHQQQVAATTWPDEKKASRRALVNALALTPTASDDTLISATRERAKKLGPAKLDVASAHITPSGSSDGPLFAAIEETVRLELARAHKMKSASDKLEEIAKHGEELKKTADKEFENRGADKADEKKTEKSREVRRELGASVDATRSLSRDAMKQSRDVQDFLEDLGNALETKDTPPRRTTDRDRNRESKPLPPPPTKAEPKPDPPKEEAKPAKPSKPTGKPAGKPAAPSEKPPAEKPAEKPPAEKPPAKPAAPPDEVFNP